MAFMKDVLQAPSASDVKASTLSLQVKSPLLNNKLLGVWAPLVRNGQRVGGKALAAELLETPYTTSIARPGARQLGPTTGYGTFDAHFHPNEPIVMTIMGATLELRASRENGVQELGLINNAEPLVIGNITCLSNYLLLDWLWEMRLVVFANAGLEQNQSNLLVKRKQPESEWVLRQQSRGSRSRFLSFSHPCHATLKEVRYLTRR